MSCQSGSRAWEQGTISLGGGGSFHGVPTYYMIALVADTNKTVTVGFGNGHTVVLPVKDNIVFHVFRDDPWEITFRNAAGKLTKYG